MKLNPLTASPQRPAPDTAAHLHAADHRLLRVDAQEGVEADRQRSLQQELNEFEQSAIAPFHGSEHILADTRDLASKLTQMGAQAEQLMKPSGQLLRKLRAVDEAA